MSAEERALRVVAQQESTSVRARVFKMRARELGGVNARTRPIIEAEAEMYARAAAEKVFLDAGYAKCGNYAVCHRLTTPIRVNGEDRGNYPFCPGCESRIKAGMATAARQFVNGPSDPDAYDAPGMTTAEYFGK